MYHVKSTFQLLLASVFIMSCGASKELKLANEKLVAENAQLAKNLSETGQKLTSFEAQTKSLNQQLGTLAGEAKDCIDAKEKIEKNLKAMNSRLAEQGISLKNIKLKAEADLEKLEDAGAQVYYNGGRVHIIVPEEYVFKSGSAAIGEKGTKALKVIADILNDFPNLETAVVGNTDNVPLQSKTYKDNWSLSTERANAVVRVLVNTYKVNPKRMISAGRSEFDPISANELADGRAMNNRIEFVLTPNMAKLWEQPVLQMDPIQ